MADIVASLPTPRHKSYPDAWFNGQVWRLVPGVDTRAESLRAVQTNLRNSAKRRGVTVVATIRDGAVYVQAQS